MSNQKSAVDKIIQKWFPVIGVLFILGGLLYLFYDGIWGALDQQGRLLVGFLAGIGLIAGGYTFSNKLKHFADVVIGGGALVLYATFVYAVRFPDVGINAYEKPEVISLAVGFLFAAIIAFYSIQRKSKYILGLGMLAGYVTPFVIAYFGNLLGYEDTREVVGYNSSFITFFLYFVAVNITALYASNKLSLRGFGLLNSLGLFVGSIALLVLGGDDFVEYSLFTILTSTVVVGLHIGFMTLTAKTFENENHPYLYAGYLLPLGWFTFILNDLFNIGEITNFLGVVLYAVLATVYFGAWYYLRNVTKSDKHFGLYIGGFVSLALGSMLLAPELNEYQGLVGSFAALVFAILYITKPILQRFVSFVAFAVFGLLLTWVNLDSASGNLIGFEAASLLLALSLAPFVLPLAFKKNQTKEIKDFDALSKIFSSLAFLAIVVILGRDFVNNSGIAKDFLFLTVPSAILAGYLAIAKETKQKITLIVGSLALGLAGYFLTSIKFLENMDPDKTHTNNLLSSRESWIGLATLIIFTFLYSQVKKLSTSVGDGLKFLSVFAPVIVTLQLFSNEIIGFYNTLGINSTEGKTDGIMALTLSIFWAVLASFLIYLGLDKKENKIEKNVGFGLIALTVLKIFVYDLAEADNTLKVVLLIVVGSLILGVSYFSNLRKNDK